MKLALKLLVAALGLALFGWFVHRAGFAEIANAFTTLGWLAPIALLPYGLVYVFDTLGWKYAFGREGAPAPFGTLFLIRWAGESINSVFASAYIGGEAVKVRLLQKRGASAMHAASSVVAGKTAQILAQVGFIAIGALCGAANLPRESPARFGMLAVTVAAMLLVGLLFWMQSHGMFTGLLAITNRLGLHIKALKTRVESLRELDQKIFDFYRTDRANFLRSTGSYLCGWMSDSLEILLVSHLLGMPVDWSQAIAVEAFISVAKAMGIFGPGAIGVQESGVVFLFYLFGLPAALGVSYAILRRGRELVYALIGGASLYAQGLSLFGRRVEA
jgi:uncharacterized protein (TIRG00374 family)